MAQLLRERLLLAPAGPDWSVLVPEGRPWLLGQAPVDRVLNGWTAALAVGTAWPVLALWWDADHAGCTLASGFRRTVGYEWLADGTPVGELEAMVTLAARLGLDPVLDVQALEDLTRTSGAAAGSDARARLLGLLAVLARTGLALPDGLTPGAPADQLCAALRGRPEVRQVEWTGWREAVRAELGAVGARPLGPRGGAVQPRGFAMAQLAAGLPLTVWGVRRRSAGWVVAGAVLVAQGLFGLARGAMRPRD